MALTQINFSHVVLILFCTEQRQVHVVYYSFSTQNGEKTTTKGSRNIIGFKSIQIPSYIQFTGIQEADQQLLLGKKTVML